MKTKITLVLLVCVVMASCSKWRWHDHHNDEDIELTDSNYFFEGDWTKFALEIEIDSLEERAGFLKEKLADNPDLQDEFDSTLEILDETIEVNNSISGSETVFLRIPRGPIPIGPGPGVIPTELQYILMNEVTSLYVTIFNEQGELVAQTEGDVRTVPRTRGRVQLQSLKFEDPEFEGPVVVQIKRVDDAGVETEVKVKAFKKAGN